MKKVKVVKGCGKGAAEKKPVQKPLAKGAKITEELLLSILRRIPRDGYCDTGNKCYFREEGQVFVANRKKGVWTSTRDVTVSRRDEDGERIKKIAYELTAQASAMFTQLHDMRFEHIALQPSMYGVNEEVYVMATENFPVTLNREIKLALNSYAREAKGSAKRKLKFIVKCTGGLGDMSVHFKNESGKCDFTLTLKEAMVDDDLLKPRKKRSVSRSAEPVKGSCLG